MFPAPAIPGAGFATIENTRSLVAIDQIASWCADPDLQVTVKPVIDLAESVAVHGYAIPDRLREHTTLRDGTCVFPYCGRDARHADKDHIVPWDRDDPGGGRTYTTPEPGWYLWRSPHAQHYLTHAGHTQHLEPPG